jgi:hypothetical protein
LEYLKENDHMGDFGIHRRITFKMDLTEMGYGRVNWIHLVQWQTSVNTAMNSFIP